MRHKYLGEIQSTYRRQQRRDRMIRRATRLAAALLLILAGIGAIVVVGIIGYALTMGKWHY